MWLGESGCPTVAIECGGVTSWNMFSSSSIPTRFVVISVFLQTPYFLLADLRSLNSILGEDDHTYKDISRCLGSLLVGACGIRRYIGRGGMTY